MDFQRLGDDIPDAHPRIQGRIGVLKQHLNIAAYRLQFTLVELGDIHQACFSPEMHAASSRLVQAYDAAPDGGLARAAFTDQPHGFACVHIKRYAINRLHVAHRLLE